MYIPEELQYLVSQPLRTAFTLQHTTFNAVPRTQLIADINNVVKRAAPYFVSTYHDFHE